MGSEIKMRFVLVWSTETHPMLPTQTKGTELDQRAWTTKLIDHLTCDQRVRGIWIGAGQGGQRFQIILRSIEYNKNGRFPLAD